MTARAVWGTQGRPPVAQDSQAAFVLNTEINPQKCPLLSAKPQCVLSKAKAEAADGLPGRKMQKQRAYGRRRGY